ncbi:MAG: hypothetical protein K6A34_03420 [Methanobrevibacter sp.]|nr:hypothetical protein [Methanobrevibacter sp.]
MDIKKILALTIIALALFSCVSVASAGLFDFLSGGEMESHTFSGFTLDIPSGSKVNENYVSANNHSLRTYNIESSKQNFTINVIEGNVVSKVSYITKWITNGAKNEGNHGDWTIIKEENNSYHLIKHGNSRIIEISGSDLDFLKKVASSYKEKLF